MLQVAISGGEVRVVDVPEPLVRRGAVLVRTSHSLISAGTESAALGSGGKPESLVLKAIRNPALVRKVGDFIAALKAATHVGGGATTPPPTAFAAGYPPAEE